MLQLKSLDFTIARGQVLYFKSIDTIAIFFVDKLSLKLNNIVYAPDCNSNLILLRQFWESDITSINNIEIITLIQAGLSITHIRKDQNLFILDLTSLNKVIQVIKPSQRNISMQVIGPDYPIHLVIKNKMIKVWHKRFGHASNVKIIKVSKLLSRMSNLIISMTIQKYIATPNNLNQIMTIIQL